MVLPHANFQPGPDHCSSDYKSSDYCIRYNFLVVVAIVATFLKVQKVAVVATLDTVAIAEIATNFALLSLKILK